jgi:uncharacterized protein YraI
MKLAKTLALVTTVLVTLATAPSHAQQLAYVSTDANLRAGPSGDFPVVAVLGGGVAITVEGCVEDYRWCDVFVGPHRGWLHAANIVYPYQGANVPLLTYGAAIGIGVIGFSVGSYWDNYYRARPWYPQRQRWIDRPFPLYSAFPGQSVFRPGFQQPSYVVIPVPRPPHRPRSGFDHHRPPHAHGPHGHPPGVQGQVAVPRPHHGMRRGEAYRQGQGQGNGGGNGNGHGAGRHP